MAFPVTLSPRQREVVALIAAGRTYAQVARELGIAKRTVRAHVQDVAEHLPGTDAPVRRVLRYASYMLVV
jgi:DNA-binding NarL/FixJ family response regulator